VHKLTHQLTQDHVVVVLEDLKTKNMTRSAKGTLAAPGNKVKAKAGLNRSILAQNWFEMQRQLTYKAQWQGGRVETVAAAYTSQTCHKCGNVNKKSRVKQALFTCVACGHEAHADVNAAKNIRQKFLEAKAPKTAGGLLVEERGGDLA
jgi:putative transposase